MKDGHDGLLLFAPQPYLRPRYSYLLLRTAKALVVMIVCQHCGASGEPLVQLAGVVYVCAACWRNQHEADRTTCSRCRTAIPGWHTRQQLNSRVVCEACWEQALRWERARQSSSLTTVASTSANPGQIVWNGDPLRLTITPDTGGFFDQLFGGAKGHGNCDCHLCRAQREDQSGDQSAPVTDEEMDYVRRSLGVES